MQVIAGGDMPDPAQQAITQDGRFVVFISSALNLVPGDTNIAWDVFVRDRLTGTTERVSVDSNGVQGNDNSGLYGVAITPDGRFVAFESAASNLVPSDSNGREIFVRDRWSGTTERVAVDNLGNQANGMSEHPSISADGRFVAFDSPASNLVVGDTNGAGDVFVHDRQTGTTTRASVGPGGIEANGESLNPMLSANGMLVAFHSTASNLVAGDINGTWDVFVHDLAGGANERVSVATGGAEGNGWSWWPWISADGRFVGFTSQATNFAVGDTNNTRDVFLRDRQAGITTLISISFSGVPGNSGSQEVRLSSDGRFAAFMSGSTNLVLNGPTNVTGRIYVRDLWTGTTELVSLATAGMSSTTSSGAKPCISGDGRYVAFESMANDLVPGDTNGSLDVFLRDRFASGFTSLCDPGVNNVIACPCGNPPASAGRGCDNSSATGGAVLGASGIAYLSNDTLQFTTHDEQPNATSVLLAGDAVVANGLVFGQGVRCAGGVLKRFYVKTAQNGSITAPDFTAGDATVSARCTALGVPLQAGEVRAFLVYYRDPVVLGGCLATSTFNATQTGTLSYWP